MKRKCENEDCKKSFKPQRATARFCSDSCRQVAYRKTRRSAPPAKPVVADPALEGVPLRVTEATRKLLDGCKQLETPLGQLALRLAVRIDTGADDSGSAFAALSKELRAALAAVTAVSGPAKGDRVDGLRDEVAAKRAQKRGA